MKTNTFDYSVLIYFLIRSAFFNIFFSKLLAFSKQDTCIAIILGMIISIPILFLFSKAKDEKLDLFSKNKNTFKYYKIINTLISITALTLTIYLFWNMTNFISSHLLYDTPKIIITIGFSIAILYTLFKGLKSLNRGKVIMFYISISMFMLSHIFLMPNIKVSNLMPFFYNSNILIGTFYYVIYIVLPLNTLSLFPKNIVDNFNIKKLIICALIFELVVFIVSFNTITIYGINLSQFLNIPEYHLLRKISFTNSLNRIDTILSIQWLFDYFITISFYLFFSIKGLCLTYKVKEKVLIITLIPLIIFITNLLNYNSITILFLYILPILIITSFFIIPFISLLNEIHNNKDTSC